MPEINSINVNGVSYSLGGGGGQSSKSCIVVSETQPVDLKDGLWIESDSDKEVCIKETIIEKDSVSVEKANYLLDLNISYYSRLVYYYEGNIYQINPSGYRVYNLDTKIYTDYQLSFQSTVEGAYLYITNYTMFLLDKNSHFYIIDILSNTYTKISNVIPDGGTIAECVFNNNKLYITGLKSGSQKINSVYIYDIAENIYTSQSFTHAGYLATTQIYNNKLYRFGGASSDSSPANGYSYRTIRIYDIENKIETTTSPGLPYGIQSGKSVLLKNKIYLLGGITGLRPYRSSQSNMNYVDFSYISIPYIYEFDPETYLTKPRGSLFYPAYSACCFKMNDTICLYGGSSVTFDTDYLNKILQLYEPEKTIFSPQTNNMININVISNSNLNPVAIHKEGSVYTYKDIDSVNEVSSTGEITPLPFHKIENYQIVQE